MRAFKWLHLKCYMDASVDHPYIGVTWVRDLDASVDRPYFGVSIAPTFQMAIQILGDEIWSFGLETMYF